jgi:hypothetical protein
MEMTAPVLSGNGAMSFTLPSNYTMENAPRPTNNEIQLKVEIFYERKWEANMRL